MREKTRLEYTPQVCIPYSQPLRCLEYGETPFHPYRVLGRQTLLKLEH